MIIPVKKAVENLNNIICNIDNLGDLKNPVIISSDEKGCVLLPLEDYEDIIETLELLPEKDIILKSAAQPDETCVKLDLENF